MVYVILVMMVMSSIAFVTLESIQHEQTTSYTQTNRQTAYQAAEAGHRRLPGQAERRPAVLRPLRPAGGVRRAATCPPRRPSRRDRLHRDVEADPLRPGRTPPRFRRHPAAGPDGATRTARTAGARPRTATSTTSRSRRRRRAAPTLTILATGRQDRRHEHEGLPGDPAGALAELDHALLPHRRRRHRLRVDDDDERAGLVEREHHPHGYRDRRPLGRRQHHRLRHPAERRRVEHPSQSTPINFSAFLASLSDISRAASVNSPSDVLRRLRPGTPGSSSSATRARSRRRPATETGGNPVGKTIPSPTAASPQTYNVPSNGAIYSSRT